MSDKQLLKTIQNGIKNIDKCIDMCIDDEGIDYSTLLDNLSIPEDLFSGIYPFNLASSVDSIARDCSYNFDWDSLDAGSLSVCSHHCCLCFCLTHIHLLGF